MNPWLWNQQQQQQQQQEQLLWMGAITANHKQRYPHQGPLLGNNLNFIPLQGFPRNRSPRPMQQQRFPNGLLPRPSQQQRFPNGLFPGPSQQQHIPNGAVPRWQQRFPQNVNPNLSSDSSYQLEEIKLARKSLGVYFEQVPRSMKSWQPMPQDSRPNLWEGEGGMMEHCTRPFPLPVQGQVTPRATVWRPQSAGEEGVEAGVSSINNNSPKTTSTTPNTISSQVRSCRDDVVSVTVSDDDDSDVQVVTSSPPGKAPGDGSRPIVVEDSPQDSRRRKKGKALV